MTRRTTLLLWIVCVLILPSLLRAEDSLPAGAPESLSADDWPWWRGLHRNGHAPADQDPPLRAVLRRAASAGGGDGDTVEATVRRSDGVQPVRVTVVALPVDARKPDGLVLVSFEPGGPAARAAPASAVPRRRRGGAREDKLSDAALVDELRSTRAELESAIERVESANEELQAANEEAISVNE